MSVAAGGPGSTMLSAMAVLWRLSPPGPDNILPHPAFVRLRDACRESYPGAEKRGRPSLSRRRQRRWVYKRRTVI